MTEKFELFLSRFFSDDAPRQFGQGWISGVLSIILGVLATCSVVALHFPQWLTIPDLRTRYPLDLVRFAIDVGILSGLLLAGISMLLRKKKALGLSLIHI